VAVIGVVVATGAGVADVIAADSRR
jgi:hypothetical protein